MVRESVGMRRTCEYIAVSKNGAQRRRWRASEAAELPPQTSRRKEQAGRLGTAKQISRP
jgi:hypothetical protein